MWNSTNLSKSLDFKLNHVIQHHPTKSFLVYSCASLMILDELAVTLIQLYNEILHVSRRRKLINGGLREYTPLFIYRTLYNLVIYPMKKLHGVPTCAWRGVRAVQWSLQTRTYLQHKRRVQRTYIWNMYKTYVGRIQLTRTSVICTNGCLLCAWL